VVSKDMGFKELNKGVTLHVETSKLHIAAGAMEM